MAGSALAAVPAAGRLADRLGRPNPVARAADANTTVVLIVLLPDADVGVLGLRARRTPRPEPVTS